MQTSVDSAKCTGCESCIGLCPTDSIKIKEGIAEIIVLFCNGCGFCLEGCGEEAIEMIE
jgi:Pyruvate/2-oxoacid:ferredoxin oxidoreductase delta subunit